LVSAKECVTTHPPKCMAPTMDGAQALVFYPTYTDAVSEWHFPTVNAWDWMAWRLGLDGLLGSCQ